jgi:hypothetical protein
VHRVHLIVGAVALVMAGMSLVGMASPTHLLRLVSRWQSRPGLKVTSIVRLSFGIALLAVAPSSQTPETIDVIGLLAVVSGLVLPFLGIARFRAAFMWWSRQSSSFVRACMALGAAVGIFILWSVAAGAEGFHHGRVMGSLARAGIACASSRGGASQAG